MYLFAYFLIFYFFSSFIYLFFYFCILLFIHLFILLFIPVFLEPYANGLSGFSNQTQSDQSHTCHNSYEEISVPDFHSHSTLGPRPRTAEWHTLGDHLQGPPGAPGTPADPLAAPPKGLKSGQKVSHFLGKFGTLTVRTPSMGAGTGTKVTAPPGGAPPPLQCT